jgi:RNA polymerase sigma factor for flagellar operon FliA
MTDANELWAQYQLTKTPELREKIILTYSHLVKFVAGRLSMHLGGHVDYEDMMSYGIFGLIDAIDKFDPAKGVKFETYASLRIKGSIIDSIRKLDWIPRSLRKRSKALDSSYAELENLLGRPPTDAELAEHLGIDPGEIDELYRKSSIVSLISLDDYMEQNQESSFSSLSGSPGLSPEKQYDVKETKKMLADEINKLSDKERQVISLYYFEELTIKEISHIMSVSESRISQIHSKAVFKLKTKLGKYRSLLFIK